MNHASTTIFAILLFVKIGFAQTAEKPKQNALSFELGKSGLIYNLNFDHKLAGNSFGFRFGAGTNFARYLNFVTVGGGGYYLVGRRNHFIELGIDLQYLIVDQVSDDQKGFSFVYPDYTVKTLYPSLNFGYRVYWKSTMFRVGLSPGLINSDIIPGGYISYGFRF